MVSPYWDEIDCVCKIRLQLFEALANFAQVLVFESFVNRQIVIPPAKMRGFAGCLTRASRTGNGVHMELIFDQTSSSQRQNSQLYAGGKTTRIGDFCRFFDQVTIQFRQTVNEVVTFAFQPEIMAQINDFYVFRQDVFCQKFLRFSVPHAEKCHING